MQKFDRNTIIGFVLIGLLLILFTYYNQPSKEQLAHQKKVYDSVQNVIKEKRYKDSLAIASTPAAAPEHVVVDSAGKKIDTLIAKAEKKFFTIENEEIKALISNYGGEIVSVELKKYKTWDQKPLFLFNEGHNKMTYILFAGTNQINTQNLIFTSADSSVNVTGKDTASITLKGLTTDGKLIQQTYGLRGGSNLLGYDVKIDGNVADLHGIKMVWSSSLNQCEKDHANEMSYSSIYYSTGEDVDHISEGTVGENKVLAKIDWVSFKQQYFNSTLICKDAIEGGNIKVSENTQLGVLKHYEADNLSMIYKNGQPAEYKMKFFFGPNHFYELKKLDIGLQKIIPMGIGIFKWFAGPVNRWFIIPLFNFFGQFIASYGIIILIMTIIVKIILYPLTYRSMVSAAKMRILKPEVDELKAKYADDQTKFGQEQLKLFQRAGVNPLGGCIPTLLQLPILVAMYSFFPGSIELRQQHFLWATDLSTYDSVYNFGFNIPFYGDHVSLFTLLMTVSSILFAIYNNQLMGATGQMKWMAYIFPIMLLGVFNKFAAALTYYYFLQNIISFIQQWVIQRFVLDDAAIHRQIQENKKKTPKKGGFMARLEKMQRDQKQLQQKSKK